MTLDFDHERAMDGLPQATEIDYTLLRTQRDWLLTLPQCDEAEGLINLLDAMLDDAS